MISAKKMHHERLDDGTYSGSFCTYCGIDAWDKGIEDQECPARLRNEPPKIGSRWTLVGTFARPFLEIRVFVAAVGVAEDGTFNVMLSNGREFHPGCWPDPECVEYPGPPIAIEVGP